MACLSPSGSNQDIADVDYQGLGWFNEEQTRHDSLHRGCGICTAADSTEYEI
jgi:hypothetical protein